MLISYKDFPFCADIFLDTLKYAFNIRRSMVQKKRHFINGKSMVEVIYRKNSKSPRKMNETTKTGERSDETWNLNDFGNIQTKKK